MLVFVFFIWLFARRYPPARVRTVRHPLRPTLVKCVIAWVAVGTWVIRFMGWRGRVLECWRAVSTLLLFRW